jgi:hypothetical protein
MLTQINKGDDMDEIAQREEELFKKAADMTLTVMKSKKGYMIVDYYTERILEGHDYSLTLDDVERFLSEGEK